MLIAKIVSGGQTGVDRGALEAAVELGFPYGGLVPKGRRAEDGVVPESFDQMTEAPFESYVYRTEQNVVRSDCTLIISREVEKFKPPERQLTGGTWKTYLFAVEHHKPHLVLVKGEVAKARAWLEKVAADLGKESLVVNVAGPRESKFRGIQQSTRAFVKKLIPSCSSVKC